MMQRLLWLLAVAALQAPAQPPPVILISGFDVGAAQDGDCIVNSDSASSFGLLQELLEADGREVSYFDTCEFGTPPIEELGAQLGVRIDGMNADQVDLIGLSMGGLIIRSYLSGKSAEPGVFAPRAETKVRKAIFLGTPHFGSPLASLAPGSEQARQLRLGGRFVWDLATWNQGLDDLREVDALAVVGSGGLGNRGDGVVGIHSASLLSFFGQTPERTRVIPACHNELAFLLCNVRLELAGVDSAEHPTAIAIRAFLSDASAWRSVGAPADEHPPTEGSADVLLEWRDADNAVVADASRGQVELPDGSAEALNPGDDGLFHERDLPAEPLPATAESDRLGALVGTVGGGANRTRITPIKPGPRIIRVVPSAGLTPGLSLAPDSLVSLFGEAFTDERAAAVETPLPLELAGVRVTLDDEPLGLLFAGPGQVNALFPAGETGLRELAIESPGGRHSVRVWLEPAVPAVFSLDGSGTGAAAALDAESFALISAEAPIANGRFVALFVTGIGAAEGLVELGGEAQEVLYAGPAPGFPGLQQINFRVDSTAGIQPLLVHSNGRTGNVTTLAVRQPLP